MPPSSSASVNVLHTCKTCNQTIFGQLNYLKHMGEHRKQRQGQLGATSTHVSSTNSQSQHNQPYSSIKFKKPMPSSSTIFAGKNKDKSVWPGGPEPIEIQDDDHDNHNKSRNHPSSNSVHSYAHSVSVFSARHPSAPKPTRRHLKEIEKYGGQSTNPASAPSSKRQRVTGFHDEFYREISEKAKEETRQIIHSVYSQIMETYPAITNDDHDAMTTLMRRIDRQVKDTRIPKNIPKYWTGKGDLESYIDTRTAKIDRVMDETIRLEIENFYTQCETKKLEFELKHLQEEAKEIEGDIAALVREGGGTGGGGDDDDDDALIIPTYLQKYIPDDVFKTYADHIMTKKSSRFSYD